MTTEVIVCDVNYLLVIRVILKTSWSVRFSLGSLDISVFETSFLVLVLRKVKGILSMCNHVRLQNILYAQQLQGPQNIRQF